MRVLAVDPGLRSGLAWWYREEAVEFCAAVCDPMPTLEHVERALARGLNVLVAEAYTITSQTAKLSAQHWSLELIGAMRWMAYSYDTTFVLQKPADAKNFVPDARLRQLGWYVSGKEDHARDAARHLCLHLTKAGQLRMQPLPLAQ